MKEELRKLIEAHDADCALANERFGFVGAFAAGTYTPLIMWLMEHRREILEALS